MINNSSLLFGEPGRIQISGFDAEDGIYDVAWSESNPTVLAASIANGQVNLYDLKVPNRCVQSFNEHKREVSCVDWNPIRKDTFLSSSYDGTLKIWNPNHFKGSQLTLPSQTGHLYQASWSPREPTILISVGSDRNIQLWDDRSPGRPIKTIENVHENEILTVDWNKWDGMKFATGSSDLTIKIWDWRMLSKERRPVNILRGHHRAIRKLGWSPFSATALYSVGYDMTMRAWELNSLNPMVGCWEGHAEFVTGLDISLHDPNILLATCSWDQSVHLLRPSNWGQFNQSVNIM